MFRFIRLLSRQSALMLAVFAIGLADHYWGTGFVTTICGLVLVLIGLLIGVEIDVFRRERRRQRLESLQQQPRKDQEHR